MDVKKKKKKKRKTRAALFASLRMRTARTSLDPMSMSQVEEWGQPAPLPKQHAKQASPPGVTVAAKDFPRPPKSEKEREVLFGVDVDLWALSWEWVLRWMIDDR
jgi:hypothetical protein